MTTNEDKYNESVLDLMTYLLSNHSINENPKKDESISINFFIEDYIRLRNISIDSSLRFGVKISSKYSKIFRFIKDKFFAIIQ